MSLLEEERHSGERMPFEDLETQRGQMARDDGHRDQSDESTSHGVPRIAGLLVTARL